MLVGAAIATACALTLPVLPATAGAVLPGPNGKIVFTSGRDDFPMTFDSNHAQLWVADNAGAVPHRVTIQNIEHRHASWSPDRTKLAYAAGEAATGFWDIYILDVTKPASGTNPVDITNTPGVAEDRPAWSPDGTRIAYQSNNVSGNIIVVQNATGPESTVLVTGGANQNVEKPAWSPDSQTIYYNFDTEAGAGVNNDIFTIPANSEYGLGATPVVTGPEDDYQAAVSPHGQNLCFTRGTYGTTKATVWRSTITGTNQTLIANSGLGDYNCAWSPDGTKIAYVQGTFTNGDLEVKSSDGSGSATDLVPNVVGRFDGNPDWAPNPSPACADSSVTVGFNAFAMVPLSCTDPAPENDLVTRSIVSSPTHGSVGSVIGNSVIYTPGLNFSGTDQFTFKGNDGTSNSQVATVKLIVNGPTTSTIQPPAITAASLTNKRFRVGQQATAISAKKVPLGTAFRFTLSAAAKLQITITRSAPGLRRGRSCLAPTTKLKRAHAKRCTRTLTVGTLTRASQPQGADSVAFSGRVGHRPLTPGAYNAVLSSSNAGGRSNAVTLAFVVVR